MWTGTGLWLFVTLWELYVYVTTDPQEDKEIPPKINCYEKVKLAELNSVFSDMVALHCGTSFCPLLKTIGKQLNQLVW